MHGMTHVKIEFSLQVLIILTCLTFLTRLQQQQQLTHLENSAKAPSLF
jgi:hypothetical protein